MRDFGERFSNNFRACCIWNVTGEHPYLPGRTLRGRVTFERIDGVARRYDVALHSDGFTSSRDTPQFAQRFRVTIANDRRTMGGEGSLKKDGSGWEPDLRLSYTRAS